MSIPYYDHNNVIPPHKGNPTALEDISPYKLDVFTFCKHFATSKERVEILKGLLQFRNKMNKTGILTGFQWLDGSFLENIEVKENRPPNDLDIVTFYGFISDETQNAITENFKEFISNELSKINYRLDHYIVDFCYDPLVTVEQTKYWLQLFSHNRDGVWKGMIQLELNTPNEDSNALNHLNSLTL